MVGSLVSYSGGFIGELLWWVLLVSYCGELLWWVLEVSYSGEFIGELSW